MSFLNRKLALGFLSRRHRDSGTLRLLPCIVHCLLVLGVFWGLAANASISMFVGGAPTTMAAITKPNGEPFLEGSREFVAHLVFLPLAFAIGSITQNAGSVQLHWLKTRYSGERI
ncbi:MAG TPA: hypothetical protein DCS43_08020 [Verrucomicrobia bacterium]|nr:hypothetical protein [Verrucomicrobiota bacterium]